MPNENIYVNEAVARMRGIPLSRLTPEQRAILRADGERRKKLIAEVERDVLINHAVAFENAQEMEKILSKMYDKTGTELLRAIAEIRANVEKQGGEWSLQDMGKHQRMENLLMQINEQLKDLGQKEVNFTAKNLSTVYQDQYLRNIYTMGKHINVNISMDLLSRGRVMETINYPWSGAMFSDRIWDNKAMLLKNLREGLTQSMILGESMGKIANRINEGIDNSKFNAMRVARTETMRVSYVAERHAMEEHDIKRVQYIATVPSERTCKVCGALHEKEFEMGKEPQLPKHPQCRCTYIPLLDEIDYSKINDTTNGIREAENYEEWRKGINILPEEENPSKAKIMHSNDIFKNDVFKVDTYKNEWEETMISIAGYETELTQPHNMKYVEMLQKLKSKNDFYDLYDKLAEEGEWDREAYNLFSKVGDMYQLKDSLYDVPNYKMAFGKVEATKLGDKINKLGSKLTEAEKNAIVQYTGSYSSPLNFHFRKGEYANDKYVKGLAEELDKALAKSVINDDIIVHRGSGYVGLGELGRMAYKDPQSVIGYEIMDKGYVSTSLSAMGRFDGDIHLQIKVPKGTKGMYVEKLSASKGEHEIILPRNTRMRINDVKTDEYGGKLEILLEVVDNE